MSKYDIRNTSDERQVTNDGFTLVELLVALMVTSVILTAVATLAFALGAANDISDDTAERQAQLRYATFRISDTLRYCKLVCGDPNDDIAVWIKDENDDEKIDAEELVYIIGGADRDYVRLVEFSVLPGWFTSQSLQDQINNLRAGWCRDDLVTNWADTAIDLIPQCSNVEFLLDQSPPDTKFVKIRFDLAENGVSSRYWIIASLRCRE